MIIEFCEPSINCQFGCYFLLAKKLIIIVTYFSKQLLGNEEFY